MQFQAGNISVDENFARFGSKSYAINKLTSVDVLEHRPSNAPWIICAVVAAVIAFAAFGNLVDRKPETEWFNTAVAAAIVGGFAWLIRHSNKPSYRLMLATAGGEVQAMTTSDHDTITKLRAALEAQIARH